MIRLGAAIALGNLLVIYGIWICSEVSGRTWFKLGEPKRLVLYLEWAMAAYASAVLAYIVLGGTQ